MGAPVPHPPSSTGIDPILDAFRTRGSRALADLTRGGEVCRRVYGGATNAERLLAHLEAVAPLDDAAADAYWRALDDAPALARQIFAADPDPQMCDLAFAVVTPYYESDRAEVTAAIRALVVELVARHGIGGIVDRTRRICAAYLPV